MQKLHMIWLVMCAWVIMRWCNNNNFIAIIFYFYKKCLLLIFSTLNIVSFVLFYFISFHFVSYALFSICNKQILDRVANFHFIKNKNDDNNKIIVPNIVFKVSPAYIISIIIVSVRILETIKPNSSIHVKIQIETLGINLIFEKKAIRSFSY